MTYSLNKSSPNQFQMLFPVIPVMDTIQEANEFSLNIYGSVVPGISFADNEEHWQGSLHHRIVSNLSFESLEMLFTVEEDWKNWHYLYKWLTYINNNKNVAGKAKKDYMVDSSILIKNNYNNPVLSINYKNMFPLSLGTVTLENRNGENFLESSCSLVYDYYEVEVL